MSTEQYTLQRLENTREREIVKGELKGKKWVVNVSNIIRNENKTAYGFCKHEAFPGNIFFVPTLFGMEGKANEGATLEVEVGVNEKKKGGWGYIVTACKLIKTSEREAQKIGDVVHKHVRRVSMTAKPNKPEASINKKNHQPGKKDAAQAGELPCLQKVLQRMINNDISEDEVRKIIRQWLFYCGAGKPSKRVRAMELRSFTKEVKEQSAWQKLAVEIEAELEQIRRPYLTRDFQPINVSEWSKDETTITVCIDEQFPLILQDSSKSWERTGVIAGIVCAGRYPDRDVLPIIPDHYIQGAGVDSPATNALRSMLKNPRVFPFIMPITIPADGGTATAHYDALVKAAVKVLLGWLLPTDGASAMVEILCDRYSGHPHEYCDTDYYRGMLDAPRFRRWHIVNVQWMNTDVVDSYIPYADMLAYLVLDPGWVAGIFDYKEWPGYVPLNLELVPRLEDVERIGETGAVSVLLDLGRDIAGTLLLKAVLAQLKRKIGMRRDLHTAALAELDRRYLAKERDLKALENQIRAVAEVFGNATGEASVRVQLVWLAIGLQKANHAGDPYAASGMLGEYDCLRAKAIENGEFDIVVHCDLNRAVGLADRFLPRDALAALDQAVEVPAGLALRGKLASARGQMLSMLGRHGEAEDAFVQAIQWFKDADLDTDVRSGEIDQTAVYRAINALDGTLPEAVAHVEAVLGLPGEAARRLARSRVKPYHHHLLLRAGYQCPTAFDQAMAEMRAQAEHWQTSIRGN